MHFAMQNPAIDQRLSTNNSRCVLTICSELSPVSGLGVGLELLDGRGALATRRFIAQALLTAGGICSVSFTGMIPWESKNSETLIR